MRVLVLPVVLLLFVPGSLHADVERRVVETKHYRLEVEATKDEGEAYGLVLEAAWTAMGAHFGKTPDLDRGEKMRVRFFATRDAWAKAMRADGLTPPTDAGGYYAPSKKTAYLFRQPTTYFTRVLLVHEATHQFHYLACTKNTQPTSAWYREGVAEYLSWHTWDGERIVLGVQPWITLTDRAKEAFEAVTADGFDLQAVAEGETWPGYSVSWALFRYLATGRDGKPLKGFDTFCRKMDSGGAVRPLFKRFFKGTKRFREGFESWLEAGQQPWAQVFNEWEDHGDGRIRGHAGVVSMCRTKRDANRVTAGLEVPDEGTTWCGGLLLHYAGPKEYVVALFNGRGHVRVDRRKDGAWTTLASRSAPGGPKDGVLQLEAKRNGKSVILTAGRKKVGSYELPPSPMGLAVDNSDLRFRDVAWDLTTPDDRGK